MIRAMRNRRLRAQNEAMASKHAAGYATYVMGANAFYNKDMIGLLETQTDFSWISQLRLGYLSNWRILHIDGFEDYIFLPVGRHIRFKWAQKVGERTSDGVNEWINVGKLEESK